MQSCEIQCENIWKVILQCKCAHQGIVTVKCTSWTQTGNCWWMTAALAMWMVWKSLHILNCSYYRSITYSLCGLCYNDTLSHLSHASPHCACIPSCPLLKRTKPNRLISHRPLWQWTYMVMMMWCVGSTCSMMGSVKIVQNLWCGRRFENHPIAIYIFVHCKLCVHVVEFVTGQHTMSCTACPPKNYNRTFRINNFKSLKWIKVWFSVMKM